MQHSAIFVGDVVEVRKHGRATVIAVPKLAASPTDEQPHADRYQVRYHEDGSTFWVTRERLRVMSLAKKRVVVAYHTMSYRQAAVHNTERSDVCLEIGCHAGVTTHMLHKRCRKVIGVDTSEHVVQVAREKYPSVQFEQLDGGDITAANQLATAAGYPDGYTKIFIDISGQAPLSVLVPLLELWLSAAPKAQLIVKNRALHCAVSAAERAAAATQPSDTCTGASKTAPERELGGSPQPAPAAPPAPAAAAGNVGTDGSLEEVVGLLLGQRAGPTDTQPRSQDQQAGSTAATDQRGQLQQRLLALLPDCETFQDPEYATGTSHLVLTGGRVVEATELLPAVTATTSTTTTTTTTAPTDPDSTLCVPLDTVKLIQAARVARVAADKAVRAQAKKERRAARKAAAGGEGPRRICHSRMQSQASMCRASSVASAAHQTADRRGRRALRCGKQRQGHSIGDR